MEQIRICTSIYGTFYIGKYIQSAELDECFNSLPVILFLVIAEDEAPEEYESEPEYKEQDDDCELEPQFESADEDNETLEDSESYDRWNNSCGEYDLGKDEAPYSYPSCSTYESQYGCTSYPTCESTCTYTSSPSYEMKNGAHYEYVASPAYEPQNPEESSPLYESQYSCECYPGYESQYEYGFSPPYDSQYVYEPSPMHESPCSCGNSPFSDWQTRSESSPAYQVQYRCKTSPVYESHYEYVSSPVYEWQNELQPGQVLASELEMPAAWNKFQKEGKSFATTSSNEPHDRSEHSPRGQNGTQEPKELAATSKPAVEGQAASEGHNETAFSCMRPATGSRTLSLSSDEQGSNQQGQLPSRPRKQSLDGTDGLLGGVRRFLDGTKKLLCGGNQHSKEPIPEGARWANRVNLLPNINSSNQKGLEQAPGKAPFPDSSSWPKGERSPHLLGTAIQPHVAKGANWQREGTTTHLPDITGRLLNKVNRLPGKCNFPTLPSHSSCSSSS